MAEPTVKGHQVVDDYYFLVEGFSEESRCSSHCAGSTDETEWSLSSLGHRSTGDPYNPSTNLGYQFPAAGGCQSSDQVVFPSTNTSTGILTEQSHISGHSPARHECHTSVVPQVSGTNLGQKRSNRNSAMMSYRHVGSPPLPKSPSFANKPTAHVSTPDQTCAECTTRRGRTIIADSRTIFSGCIGLSPCLWADDCLTLDSDTRIDQWPFEDGYAFEDDNFSYGLSECSATLADQDDDFGLQSDTAAMSRNDRVGRLHERVPRTLRNLEHPQQWIPVPTPPFANPTSSYNPMSPISQTQHFPQLTYQDWSDQGFGDLDNTCYISTPGRGTPDQFPPHLQHTSPEFHVPQMLLNTQSPTTAGSASLSDNTTFTPQHYVSPAAPWHPYPLSSAPQGAVRFQARSAGDEMVLTTNPPNGEGRSEGAPRHTSHPSDSEGRELPFSRCKICNTVVSKAARESDRKSNVTRHIRNHHRGLEKPMCLESGCDGKTFARQDLLKRHERLCHGISPENKKPKRKTGDRRGSSAARRQDQ